MPTLTPEQRAQIARENGAKSRGPVTQEGKQSSSRNALKSGEFSNQILDLFQPHFAVLSNENQDGFQALLADLTAVYRPAHLPAHSIVRDIATARWQIDRYNTSITMAWDLALSRSQLTPTSLPSAQAFLESNVRAAVDIFGSSAVVTRLTREVARLQRQIAFLERQLLFVHKHFQPVPTQPEPAPLPSHENEPAIVTSESDPIVIDAYRAQFPRRPILIVPPHSASQDQETVIPVPRRAA